MNKDFKAIESDKIKNHLPINLVFSETSDNQSLKAVQYERFIVSDRYQTRYLRCEYPTKPISKILSLK